MYLVLIQRLIWYCFCSTSTNIDVFEWEPLGTNSTAFLWTEYPSCHPVITDHWPQPDKIAHWLHRCLVHELTTEGVDVIPFMPISYASAHKLGSRTTTYLGFLTSVCLLLAMWWQLRTVCWRVLTKTFLFPQKLLFNWQFLENWIG